MREDGLLVINGVLFGIDQRKHKKYNATNHKGSEIYLPADVYSINGGEIGEPMYILDTITFTDNLKYINPDVFHSEAIFTLQIVSADTGELLYETNQFDGCSTEICEYRKFRNFCKKYNTEGAAAFTGKVAFNRHVANAEQKEQKKPTASAKAQTKPSTEERTPSRANSAAPKETRDIGCGARQAAREKERLAELGRQRRQEKVAAMEVQYQAICKQFRTATTATNYEAIIAGLQQIREHKDAVGKQFLAGKLWDVAQRLQEAEKACADKEAECISAQQELAGLGFFQMSKKKMWKEKLEMLQAELQTLKADAEEIRKIIAGLRQRW